MKKPIFFFSPFSLQIKQALAIYFQPNFAYFQSIASNCLIPDSKYSFQIKFPEENLFQFLKQSFIPIGSYPDVKESEKSTPFYLPENCFNLREIRISIKNFFFYRMVWFCHI